MKIKVCVLVFLLCCWIGIAVATATVYSGTVKVVDGVDTVCCTSAQFFDGLLGGVDAPRYFVGSMPVLRTLYEMESNLDDGSMVLTEINKMLARTKTVKDSVFVATEMLSVLREVLTEDATVYPVSSGTDLRHKCTFCQDLDAPLGDAEATLSNSVAKALEQVRALIDERISSTERTRVKDQLQQGTKSLADFKNKVRDVFKVLFGPNGVPRVREIVDRGVPGIVTLFVMVGWVLVLFAMIMMCCWCFREKRASGLYARTPHRLSCCTMCIAIPVFVVPALIIGGVLDVVTTALSAVCLTMDGFDGQRFVEFQNLTGGIRPSDLATIVVLIDSCVAGKNGENPNILDLINGTDSDGSVKPLREIIYDVSVTPIQAAFSQIDDKQAEEAGTPLNENPAIVRLTDKLASTPIDAMMLPVRSKFTRDAAYDAMLAHSDLAVALATSGRCDDFHSEGNVIPGILNFLDSLSNYAVTDFSSLNSTSCVPTTIVCSPGDDVCTGGKAYVALKRKLVQDRIYKCDLWHKGDNVPCDPKDMVKNAGVWENDCLTTDSAGNPQLLRLSQTCNLVEFTAYIQDYSRRIDNSMQRLNDEASTFMDDLKVKLEGMVNQYFLNPFLSIVDGFTCGFLPVAYKDLVDGMCYQGVVGIRTIGKGYTIIGVSMMCMSIVLYFSWRWEVDNVNAEIKRVKRIQVAAATQTEAWVCEARIPSVGEPQFKMGW